MKSYSKTIAIYGYGVVGNAVHTLVQNYANVLIADPFLNYSISDDDLKQLCEDDLVCICVNANSTQNGYDSRSIISILNNLEMQQCKALITIKTTISPEQVTLLLLQYKNLNLAIWPEFLNNDTANTDILKNIHLFGGDMAQTQIFKNFIEDSTVLRVSPAEAMSMKILWNLFGALKVSFWHSIQNSGFCDIPSIKKKWDSWVEMYPQGDLNILYKDGKYGYGGKCYPKEVDAYLARHENSLIEAMDELNSKNRGTSKWQKSDESDFPPISYYEELDDN